MLEDIFKLPHLKKTLDREKAVNSYIYNRTLLLNMMRYFMGQRDMVRPTKTRFATAFITFNCFRNHKKNLKKMFASEAWNKSKFPGEAGGGGNSEKKPLMGYIYEAMDIAKERIASSFKNKEDKYKQFFEIIDKRWNCQLHQDLHAAGHELNQGLYYNNPSVEDDSEVITGLMECIHKLSLSEEDELKMYTELPTYRDPNDWLEGEEDDLVFEGDNLTWDVVAEAMGVDEEPYTTRITSRRKEGAESSSRSRGAQMIDEDEEENDVGAYKEVVEEEVDDETIYEDLDDL
ncbi:unnamed protein product [Lactuca saligna]|uniref:Uncharacterized protein n=1 Tax=Lactuca saligna TaxID=75948 RepID=A0AA35YYD9_LACSI|nr:unnamed protein product [Lactuca saligna]